jgi:hypothetical protein
MSTKKGVVEEVIQRLKKKERPVRTKRTLVLTENTYKEFERLCRTSGRYPSEVVDEFIALFVEQKGG